MASNADSNLMSLGSNAALARQARRMIGPGLMLVMAGVIISAFLLPLAYMLTTAFRDDRAMTEAGGETPWYPATAASFEYNGEKLAVLKVPTADGVKNWALLTRGREDSDFIDPANPAAGPINWKGSWRTLERDWTPYFTFDSITESWRRVNFTNLFKNSLFVSVISVFFTLISCTIVAYGYARFKFPGKDILFWVLTATVFLPQQVTWIPLAIFYSKIGWSQSFLPLIAPALFGSAFEIFLLRQFIMSIPKEMDEAAMIDGAGPLRTLVSVIVPNIMPAFVAAAMFHFFFKWNDYFWPLIMLSGKEDLYTIPLGLAQLNNTFGTFPGLAMASGVIAITLPIGIFIIFQRYFMLGNVVTGVDK